MMDNIMLIDTDYTVIVSPVLGRSRELELSLPLIHLRKQFELRTSTLLGIYNIIQFM
jgi:hypothetical protein